MYYAEITEFKPWYMEFSRGAMASNEHADQYAVFGTIGLKIKLTDETLVIVGTQKGADMHKYLQYLLNKGIITNRQLPTE